QPAVGPAVGEDHGALQLSAGRVAAGHEALPAVGVEPRLEAGVHAPARDLAAPLHGEVAVLAVADRQPQPGVDGPEALRERREVDAARREEQALACLAGPDLEVDASTTESGEALGPHAAVARQAESGAEVLERHPLHGARAGGGALQRHVVPAAEAQSYVGGALEGHGRAVRVAAPQQP